MTHDSGQGTRDIWPVCLLSFYSSSFRVSIDGQVIYQMWHVKSDAWHMGRVTYGRRHVYLVVFLVKGLYSVYWLSGDMSKVAGYTVQVTHDMRKVTGDRCHMTLGMCYFVALESFDDQMICQRWQVTNYPLHGICDMLFLTCTHGTLKVKCDTLKVKSNTGLLKNLQDKKEKKCSALFLIPTTRQKFWAIGKKNQSVNIE